MEIFNIRKISDIKNDPAMAFVFGAWRDSAVGIPLVRRDGGRNNDHEIYERRAIVQPKIHKVLDVPGLDIYVASINDPDLSTEYGGFIVAEGKKRKLHYLYVKKIYRVMGLGKSLITSVFGMNSTDIMCMSKGTSKEWARFSRGRKMIYVPCEAQSDTIES